MMIAPRVGRRYWFEYHCNESPQSADAAAWFRSHERVLVCRIAEPGIGRTMRARAENGSPRVFRARWADGFEWDVFEDELLDSRREFCRPDPPQRSRLTII